MPVTSTALAALTDRGHQWVKKKKGPSTLATLYTRSISGGGRALAQGLDRGLCGLGVGNALFVQSNSGITRNSRIACCRTG